MCISRRRDWNTVDFGGRSIGIFAHVTVVDVYQLSIIAVHRQCACNVSSINGKVKTASEKTPGVVISIFGIITAGNPLGPWNPIRTPSTMCPCQD
jgi:hypothetical protein